MGLIPQDRVRDPDKPLCIVHHVRVKPEHVDEYARYVREHYVLRANTEPGCTLYDVWQDNVDPCHFVTVENWANLAALEEHMQKPYVLAGLDKAYAMHDSEMTSYFLQSLLAN